MYVILDEQAIQSSEPIKRTRATKTKTAAQAALQPDAEAPAAPKKRGRKPKAESVAAEPAPEAASAQPAAEEKPARKRISRAAKAVKVEEVALAEAPQAEPQPEQEQTQRAARPRMRKGAPEASREKEPSGLPGETRWIYVTIFPSSLDCTHFTPKPRAFASLLMPFTRAA